MDEVQREKIDPRLLRLDEATLRGMGERLHFKIPYCPFTPTPKQRATLLLMDTCPEMLFGGAVAGGKSTLMLMAALRYVDQPDYRAIIIRRNRTDLNMAGGLIPKSKEWLEGTDARWNGSDFRWTFPSGATLEFGYLRTEQEKHRYKSTEFHFIGFDELTQFTESMYTYLRTRLRRSRYTKVPLRTLGATNPGDIGHEWVKTRFVTAKSKERIFMPARLIDNPHLDAESYKVNLDALDPVERKRLRDGDWDASTGGQVFDKKNFIVWPASEPIPAGSLHRHWDLASTEPSPSNPDPDWMVGLLALAFGDTTEEQANVLILDVEAFRLNPAPGDRRVKVVAKSDKKRWGNTSQSFELEPGSASKKLLAQYQALMPFAEVRGVRPTKNKKARAKPVAFAATQGRVFILEAPWNAAFLKEMEDFDGTGKVHDDRVDALSGWWQWMMDERDDDPHEMQFGELDDPGAVSAFAAELRADALRRREQDERGGGEGDEDDDRLRFETFDATLAEMDEDDPDLSPLERAKVRRAKLAQAEASAVKDKAAEDGWDGDDEDYDDEDEDDEGDELLGWVSEEEAAQMKREKEAARGSKRRRGGGGRREWTGDEDDLLAWTQGD